MNLLNVIERGMTITKHKEEKTPTPSNSSEYDDDGVADDLAGKLNKINNSKAADIELDVDLFN